MADQPVSPPPPEPLQPAPLGENPWPFIESVLAERNRALLDDLRPPASDAELDAAQAALGVTFPEAFRLFYRGHDGQKGEFIGRGFFFGAKFMSLEDIVAKHRFWMEILASDPATYGKEGDSTSVPEGAIRTEYINPHWIPFADGHGNHMGLDFAPGPNGVPGQCITFGRDQRIKFLVGRSFENFVSWIQPRFWPGHSEFRELEGFDPPAPIAFQLVPPAAPEIIGLLRILHGN